MAKSGITVWWVTSGTTLGMCVIDARFEANSGFCATFWIISCCTNALAAACSGESLNEMRAYVYGRTYVSILENIGRDTGGKSYMYRGLNLISEVPIEFGVFREFLLKVRVERICRDRERRF